MLLTKAANAGVIPTQTALSLSECHLDHLCDAKTGFLVAHQ